MTSLDLPQGTLDLLILRTLLPGAQHGWGDFRAGTAGIGEYAAHPAGVPLSGAASPGAAGLGEGEVGHFRQQPQGKVLRADPQRAQATRSRNRKLAEADLGGGAGA